MAAALRRGGGIFFSKSLGGVYSKFFRPGGYTPYPPIPDPWFMGESYRNKGESY